MSVKLCDIPPVIINGSTTYTLRGVLNYRHGRSQLRNSVGHYSVYTRRGGGNWELYDDMKKKPEPINDHKTVFCEMLYYSV